MFSTRSLKNSANSDVFGRFSSLTLQNRRKYQCFFFYKHKNHAKYIVFGRFWPKIFDQEPQQQQQQQPQQQQEQEQQQQQQEEHMTPCKLGAGGPCRGAAWILCRYIDIYIYTHILNIYWVYISNIYWIYTYLYMNRLRKYWNRKFKEWSTKSKDLQLAWRSLDEESK